MKKYVDVGETVEINGKFFKCVKNSKCEGCAFLRKEICDNFPCYSEVRRDKTNVIFKEVK